MIAVDTNILVRYLTRDEAAQFGRVERAISEAVEQGEFISISLVVICELAWVLESSFGYSRQELINALDALTHATQFGLERRELVSQAIDDCRRGKADFADYLIGRLAAEEGCTITLTFDKALKNHPAFRVL